MQDEYSVTNPKQLTLPFDEPATSTLNRKMVYTHLPVSENPLFIEASEVVFAPSHAPVDDYADFVSSKLSSATTNLVTFADRIDALDDGVLNAPCLLAGVLGLSGEVGEVVDHVKKVLFQGKPFSKEKVVDELGDVCFYLQTTMSACGTSFEEVIRKNQEKLTKRYPSGFSVERSENRSD